MQSTNDQSTPPSVEQVYTAAEIQTKKIAACAVSLGVAILNNMIGVDVSNSNAGRDTNELMATAILSELKL